MIKYYKTIEQTRRLFYKVDEDKNNVECIEVVLNNDNVKLYVSTSNNTYDSVIYEAIHNYGIECNESEYNHALLSLYKCTNTMKDEFNFN